jgi:hypothetical protein
LAVGINHTLLLGHALSGSDVANGDLSLIGDANLGFVDAPSGFHVARVVSASVVVVTGNGGKDATSSKAGSGGAFVGSLALLLNNASDSLDKGGDGTVGGEAGRTVGRGEDAVSGPVVAFEGVSVSVLYVAGLGPGHAAALRITEAGAAKIRGGWALNSDLNDSSLRIARSGDASVESQWDGRKGLVDAFSGGEVAPISGAQVVIVAIAHDVHASSGVLVAAVVSARIEIIAVLGNVTALSSLAIAAVNGASISVIAGSASAEHASSGSLVTGGGCAFIIGVAGEGSEHAASHRVAGVDGALDSVVAEDSSLHHLSGDAVASEGVAFVSDVHLGNIKSGFVDASLGDIARIISASIVVVTVSGGVDASSILVARINGASIVVIAGLSDVDAFSGVLVATVGGARIAVIAVSGRVLDSVGGIAELNDAFFGLNDLDGLMDALALDAGVDGAGIVVVANSLLVLAASLGVAGVDGAGIVVVANSLLVLASKDDRAAVVSADIVIVAVSGHVSAGSGGLVTAVGGAGVFIVAVLGHCEQSLGEGASGDDALISALVVDLGEVDGGVLAAEDSVAGIHSARISVVACDGLVLDLSSSVVTPVSCAGVLVIHINRSVDASAERIAGVDGAGVEVVAAPGGVHASSLLRHAFSSCASVGISAHSGHVSAQTGVGIAEISGAVIVVVANSHLGLAFSGDKIALAGGARVGGLSALLGGVHAPSVDAGVSGASIVVIADHSSVDASDGGITPSRSASSSLVALDGGMLDSELRVAPISRAGILVIKSFGREREEDAAGSGIA